VSGTVEALILAFASSFMSPRPPSRPTRTACRPRSALPPSPAPTSPTASDGPQVRLRGLRRRTPPTSPRRWSGRIPEGDEELRGHLLRPGRADAVGLLARVLVDLPRRRPRWTRTRKGGRTRAARSVFHLRSDWGSKTSAAPSHTATTSWCMPGLNTCTSEPHGSSAPQLWATRPTAPHLFDAREPRHFFYCLICHVSRMLLSSAARDLASSIAL
jgi:hypothetical protein